MDIQQINDLIYGGGLVSKAEPSQSDLHVNSTLKRKKRERTEARIGLASTLVGGTAGVAATGTAIKDFQNVRRHRTNYIPKHLKKVPATRATKIRNKYALPVAGAALGLQVGNNVGDIISTKVLARESRKKVAKADIPSKKDLALKAVPVAQKGAEQGLKYGKGTLKRAKEKVEKGVVWEGTISKVDTDKRQVFGWASVVEVNGEPVVDLQGDVMSIDEVEKSAYNYVVKSRKGGDMHRRVPTGEIPLQVSDMIESFVVTPEKVEKMNLPKDTPLGWWVGYQINDPAVWADVKSGKRTGFSVHGTGKRTPL